MASNDNYEEKPNLRPTKRLDAGGKTIFLHHNPNHPSNKSYIHAVWTNPDDKNLSTKPDPFGIDEPNVEYSLNKQHRWEVLDEFQRHMIAQSSSSSDDERDVQSDSEQQPRRKKKLRHRGQGLNTHQTKYRLYELHNINRQANYVSVTSNTGPQRTQRLRQTYTQGPPANPDENRGQRDTTDVTYYAVVPPPKEKQLSNIRKQHGAKAKKTTASFQRSKFTQVKESLNAAEQLKDDDEQTSTDEEELMAATSPMGKPDPLQLNDFFPTVPVDGNSEASKIKQNLVTIKQTFDTKSSRIYPDENSQFKKYHRQVTREEKLYNRDKAAYIQKQSKQGETFQSTEKSRHHLMSLSFRSVLIAQNHLTIEHLSKTFGKNFLHAQCFPTKYLICLTDRLKFSQWSNQSELFPIYSNLNAYLILIVDENEQSPKNDLSLRVQVGLNMDLYADTIEIETLYESSESIYQINDLVEKTIEFITILPFETFKPIDSELTRKRTVIRNEEDNELSESEFLNKQILHLQLLDRKPLQTKIILQDEQLNEDLGLDEYALIRPEICTSCYQDMNDETPMSALKACAHWFCNDCWRQYLKNSINNIKVVLCPEWNCRSVVDIGTILSLVNIRCMNIYERNIEKCLVNLSRAHVKCPSKSCSNIIQVIGSGIDHVHCRCGHEFCLSCKQEPHFPSTCNAYRIYMDEVFRSGDLLSDYNAVTQVKGRNCISCNNFIEKNGGCNHMTCSCGAEFCWTCVAYWKDHFTPEGSFTCPKAAVPLQEEILAKQHNHSRRYYYNAIYHRRERTFQIQCKQKENAKRLLSTIPLDKGPVFDCVVIKSQIDKRESVLRHLYEMVKYIAYLHSICEYVAVSADGYGNNPSEFQNSLRPLEVILFSMSQTLEGGKGYKAIEQINQLHVQSERIIERLRRAVIVRELRQIKTAGYVTS